MKTVTLISKDDCSLCTKALGALELLQQDFPFHINIRKITPADKDYSLYHENIPVGLVDGVEVFRYHVDREKLLGVLTG